MADRAEIAEKNFAGRELKRLALVRCLLEIGHSARVGATLRNNGWTDEARPPSLESYGTTPSAAPNGAAWSGGVLVNAGWTDEARTRTRPPRG